MSEMNYRRVGRLIYGAYRHGGNDVDLQSWIASDLGIDASGAASELDQYSALFAKYPGEEEFELAFCRFIGSLKNRPLAAGA